MPTVFNDILSLSEVWALLIPLYILQWRKQPKQMQPVIFYLWTALLLDLIIDGLAEYNKFHGGFRISNNPLYNIHSLLRFSCFMWFFSRLNLLYFNVVWKIIVAVFIFFIFYQFLFVDNFFNPDSISGNLLAMEAFLLLAMCLYYYFNRRNQSGGALITNKDFWIVTGLSIYVTINFFLFLYYDDLIKTDSVRANAMWDLHNLAYILLCIFIAKAIHATARVKHIG